MNEGHYEFRPGRTRVTSIREVRPGVWEADIERVRADLDHVIATATEPCSECAALRERAERAHWRPIDDNPPVCRFVQIAYGLGTVTVGYLDDDGRWLDGLYRDDDGEPLPIHTPTHWMELADAPDDTAPARDGGEGTGATPKEGRRVRGRVVSREEKPLRGESE